jgi:hypothetical protein
MSFRTLSLASTLTFALLSQACAAGESDDPGTGGGGTTTPTSTTSSSGNGGTTTGPGGGGGPPAASWDVQANFTINGHAVGDAIKSAVARHESVDGHEYVSVIVTDVESFCAALGAGDCGTDPHFRLQFDLVGSEPGTYHVEEGTVGVSSGDVPASCIGGGLGADSGTVTFTKIDLELGVVELSFDVQFFTGHAEGTIVAPVCVVE